MTIIPRDSYLRELEPFIRKPFIKVLTGIRRCGKSCILLLLMEKLRQQGAGEDRLIYINFDSLEHLELRNAPALHALIKQRMKYPGPYYIFLDEIQEVEGWEQAVNSLLLDERADIYITGSNSRLLSSELATYITGRYVEFRIQTLSFGEFLRFRGRESPGPVESAGPSMADLNAYIRLGGFPAVHTEDYGEDESYRIINVIYSSAILRDTIQRWTGSSNSSLITRVILFPPNPWRIILKASSAGWT